MAKTNQTQSDLDKQLLQAAMENNLDRINALIAEGANIEAKDIMRRTPLHLASNMGHVLCARALIAAGADVDATDKNKRSALYHAAANDNVDSLRDLLAKRASVAKRSDKGQTPLHPAAKNGYTDCVVALIAAGADVEVVGKDDLTAKQLAEREGRHEVIAVIDAHIRMQALLKEAVPTTPSAVSSPASRRKRL